jgi:hypothetical protein
MMPSFRLNDFRPLAKNSLLGFASGRLDCGDGLALDLADLTIHRRDGKAWVGWPARPLIDRDGHTLRGENGKVRYSPPLVRPADCKVAARIEAAILAAVRLAHPDVLGEGEAGGHGR